MQKSPKVYSEISRGSFNKKKTKNNAVQFLTSLVRIPREFCGRNTEEKRPEKFQIWMDFQRNLWMHFESNLEEFLKELVKECPNELGNFEVLPEITYNLIS